MKKPFLLRKFELFPELQEAKENGDLLDDLQIKTDDNGNDDHYFSEFPSTDVIESVHEELKNYKQFFHIFDGDIDFSAYDNKFEPISPHNDPLEADFYSQVTETVVSESDSDSSGIENDYRICLPFGYFKNTNLKTLDEKPIVQISIFLVDAKSSEVLFPKIAQLQLDFNLMINMSNSHLSIRGVKKNVELGLGAICKIILDNQFWELELNKKQLEYWTLFEGEEEIKKSTLVSLKIVNRNKISICGTKQQIEVARRIITSYFSQLKEVTHHFDNLPANLNYSFFLGTILDRTFTNQTRTLIKGNRRSDRTLTLYGRIQDINKTIEKINSFMEECICEEFNIEGMTQYTYLLLVPKISQIVDQTGCKRIVILRNTTRVGILGSSQERISAFKIIQDFVSSTPQILEEKYDLPSKKIAIALIGKKGTRLNELKEKANCIKIQIDTSVPDKCFATIIGTKEQILSAKSAIKYKIREIELDIVTPVSQKEEKDKRKDNRKDKAKTIPVQADIQKIEPVIQQPIRQEPEKKDFKGRGSKMLKANTSNQVINIVPPRKCWDDMQSIRTLTLPNQRCGPHFSFFEPFLVVDHFEEAASILKEAMAHIPPFTVTLAKFNHFKFHNSAMLYLEPTFEPKNGLSRLFSAILSIFPQCTDLIKDGKYTPHMSIARFHSEDELMEAKAIIERSWQPVAFTVKEIYLLHRIGADPFEVMHVIPLGNEPSAPYFGPGSAESNPNDESELGRTVFVSGLAVGSTDQTLLDLVRYNKKQAHKVEICLNPNGKPRTCGIIEFKNRKTANEFIANFTSKGLEYVKPMYSMMFPGVVGDSCSLNGVKKYLHKYPWVKNKHE